MNRNPFSFVHFFVFSFLLAAAITFPQSSIAAPQDWETSLLIRERAQFFENFNFNDKVDKDRWELNSLASLTAKRKFNDNFSLVLNAKFIDGRNEDWGGPVTHFSQSDLYKAYLEYKTGSIDFKLGRQQLVYGDQRLLGHLGWKDVSRSFDGAKVVFKQDNLKLDFFIVRPADIVNMGKAPAGTSSGQSLVGLEDIRLAGLYATFNTDDKSGVDVYLINWTHSDSATAAPGRDINTYGARLFAKIDDLDFTGEFVFQSGDWNATTDQDASAMAIKAGYTFPGDEKTRIGLEYAQGSGDGKADNTNETFVFPFHTNHMHYGEMDFFSWSNMKDTRFSVRTSPLKNLTLTANYHILELDEATDGWYTVVGNGVDTIFGPGTKETDAGTEIDLKAVYKVRAIKGLKLVLNYSEFAPGDAVKERNGGVADKAQYVYAFAAYKF